MAQKNANKRSKTATEKTKQSTEPRIQVLARWAGINISNLAPGWTPSEDYDDAEFDNTTDTELKQWLIQDNMLCNDNGSVETRRNARLLCTVPDYNLREVVLMVGANLYVAAEDSGSLFRYDIANGVGRGTKVAVLLRDTAFSKSERFTDLCVIGSKLIATTSEGRMFTGFLDSHGVCLALTRPRPIIDDDDFVKPSRMTITPVGLTSPSCPVALSFCYTMSNRFGSCLPSKWTNSVVYNLSPAEFNHENYLSISVILPGPYNTYGDEDTYDKVSDATGIDIYCRIDDAQDAIWVGHITLKEGDLNPVYNWTGSINSTADWAVSALTLPMENTTAGPHGKYCTTLEDRLFVWGGPESPYRVYFGGNPGNEIQFGRGVGGGWMDADYQNFTQLYDLHNFKTWKANILTILGDTPNVGDSPRYNIVDHNMAITNEIQVKGMFLERVQNVLGVKSRHSSMVLFDGLYALNRYGVGITTMPMSSNVEDKQEYISDAIKPVFQEYSINRLRNSKMAGYKKSLYFIFGNESDSGIDNILFCYNIPLKSWFTYSFPEIKGNFQTIFSIDGEVTSPGGFSLDGLGIVTDKGVYLVEEFGEHKPADAPPFPIHLETGQISSKQPLQTTSYFEQLELRFDYLIGDLVVAVNYMDYWGRKNKVTKYISVKTLKRNWSEYIRLGTYVESYNIQIIGHARCRLTHFMCKVYPQSNRVGLVYGLNDHSSRSKLHGRGHENIHHEIASYNNLKDCIVP